MDRKHSPVPFRFILMVWILDLWFLSFFSFYYHVLIFGCAFVSSCGEQRLSSSCGTPASYCSGFSCCEAQAVGHVSFSSGGLVGSVVAIPRSMWLTGLVALWHLPGPGIEPMSLALAGRFFTTEPPGKPLICGFLASKFFFRCRLQVSF